MFERLEQRHSLSEIVIALRVPPEDVRDLYHTWLVGLWAGELQRKEPALPARHTDRETSRWVTPGQLAQLLAALPAKQATRISIARVVGELMIPDETDPNGFVEYRNLHEHGGFDASGPITIADILARVGAGEYRVSAYGFEPRGLRWEVFVRLGRSPARWRQLEESQAGPRALWLDVQLRKRHLRNCGRRRDSQVDRHRSSREGL